jgi:hypothetical protein
MSHVTKLLPHKHTRYMWPTLLSLGACHHMGLLIPICKGVLLGDIVLWVVLTANGAGFRLISLPPASFGTGGPLPVWAPVFPMAPDWPDPDHGDATSCSGPANGRSDANVATWSTVWLPAELLVANASRTVAGYSLIRCKVILANEQITPCLHL